MVNPLATGDTVLCDRILESAEDITMQVGPDKHKLQDFLVNVECGS